MEQVIAYGPAILKGTLLTIQLAVVSLLVSVLLGLVGAWAKLSVIGPWRAASARSTRPWSGACPSWC